MTGVFAGLMPKKNQRPRVRTQAEVTPTRADSNAALRKVVGERMLEARRLNGYDQTEAAKLLAYRNSTQLSLIEQGKRLPPHELVIKAATVYGVATDFIYGLTAEPERDPKAADRQAAMRHVRSLVEATTERMVGLLLQYLAHDVPSVKTTETLLTRADDLAMAVNRIREMNRKLFDDKLRGGNTLVKLADEMAAACVQAREMLSRHERVTEFKIRTEEKRTGVTRPLFEAFAVEGQTQ